MPTPLVLSLALLQALVVTMWTLYALFLPGLLAQVGLPTSLIPWLVLLDQALFVVADIAMGVATDRITRLFGRLGPWLAGMALVCCLAFLAMPLVATGPEQRGWLLGAVVIWVVCSSALRGPPLALIGKRSTASALPRLTALVLFGLTLARAAVPYVNLHIQQLDPRWPFAITSGVLLLVVLVAVGLEPRRADPKTDATPKGPRRSPWPLLGSGLLLAAGVEIHTFLQSRALLARFASEETLPALSPILWISGCLGLWLAARRLRRESAGELLPALTLLGTAGFLLVALASDLNLLLLGMVITGLAWGACLNALVSELLLTAPGREGLRLGLWSAVLALAAFLRVGLVLAGLAGQITTLVPALLWGAVAMVLIIRWRWAPAQTSA